MSPLADLPPSSFDVLRRMGSQAVTAKEVGVEGSVMVSLVNRGFLLADRDGSPTIYRLSPMGEGAHAVLTAPIAPREAEGAIGRIQRIVAEYYNIPLSEMTSDRRPRAIARPRQIAMYLCRMLTPHSLPRIGTYFGGRDHTTVMHAIKTVEDLCEINHRGIATQVDELFRKLDPEAVAA